MAFHIRMSSSSFSGSWWMATQTGPPIDASRAARSWAHASPAPAAIRGQEYGVLKLIQGMRSWATSALAVATAFATPLGPQKVRCTPRCLPISDSHCVTSELEP